MSNRQRIASVVVRLLLTMVFLGAATRKFLSMPFEVASFVHFGYPLWFMYMIGALQLFGTILLWTRKHVGHGALLLAAVMVGAVASHLRVGDPIPKPVPAFVLLILLLLLSYVHRVDLLKQTPRAVSLEP